jgi:hypothetical protein
MRILCPWSFPSTMFCDFIILVNWTNITWLYLTRIICFSAPVFIRMACSFIYCYTANCSTTHSSKQGFIIFCNLVAETFRWGLAGCFFCLSSRLWLSVCRWTSMEGESWFTFMPNILERKWIDVWVQLRLSTSTPLRDLSSIVASLQLDFLYGSWLQMDQIFKKLWAEAGRVFI